MARAGFTVAEFLISALITGIILTVILFAFSSGERSFGLNALKIDTQAEARRALDWVTRDVREGVIWEIASAGNSPSAGHLKFRTVEGWNTTADTFLLAANYTEYTYNATSQSMTRALLDASNNTLQQWRFNNIAQPPFYTRDSGGGLVALNGADLLASRVIIVSVSAQELFRNAIAVNSTVTSEVKIRNE